MGRPWDKKEDGLFFNKDLSNYDIAYETGRTLLAVKKRRYDLTGTYDDDMDIPRMNTVYLSQAEKISRLYTLAEKLGVRFGEMLKR